MNKWWHVEPNVTMPVFYLGEEIASWQIVAKDGAVEEIIFNETLAHSIVLDLYLSITDITKEQPACP